MKRCKFLSIMLLLTMVFSIAPTQVYAKKKIAISDKKIAIEVGDTYQLSVTGTNANVSWTSADESVASVDKDGVVTGKTEGKSKVTGRIGNKKYSCIVTVEFHNYRTITIPYSEYAEVVANTIDFKGKNVEVDIDDENITIRATEEEFQKIDKKCMKEYTITLKWYYDIKGNGNEYDFYEIRPYSESAYCMLFQGTIKLALHAYITGYTENDVVVRIHKYKGTENGMFAFNSADENNYEVVDLKMPTLEEIYSYSDPDC